jgi:hypothetical protein
MNVPTAPPWRCPATLEGRDPGYPHRCDLLPHPAEVAHHCICSHRWKDKEDGHA